MIFLSPFIGSCRLCGKTLNPSYYFPYERCRECSERLENPPDSQKAWAEKRAQRRLRNAKPSTVPLLPRVVLMVAGYVTVIALFLSSPA